MSRTWIITGCSTGIGRAIAIAALEAGHKVAVTARNPDDIADIVDGRAGQALALALDVASPASIRAAVARTRSELGPIHALVNNAGFGYVSSIEEGDEEQIKALFEVNFFGALRMIQAVLPDMRAAGAGRIINISSLAGRIANPATGFYSSSKFALEGMSEALAREVEPLGIHVVALAPGQFRSDFSGRSLKAEARSIADYREGAHTRIDLVKSADQKQPGDPAKLAAIVLKLAQMPHPPRQLVAGPDAYAAITARTQEILGAMEENRAWTITTNLDD